MDDRDGAPCRTASVVRHVVRSAMALAFLLSMNPISFAQNSGAVRETKTSFESGGKKIAVKIFAPEAGANGGGVLVLHGAGVMRSGERTRLACAISAHSPRTPFPADHPFSRKKPFGEAPKRSTRGACAPQSIAQRFSKFDELFVLLQRELE